MGNRLLRKNRVCLPLLSLCVIFLIAFRLLQLPSIWGVDYPSLLPSISILSNQTISPSPIPTFSRHLFLGIFTNPSVDGRLRNVIRKTYLESKYEMTGFPKICSVAPTSFRPTCQIVYAFVAEGQPQTIFSSEEDMIFLPGESNRMHQLFLYFLEFNWTLAGFHFDFLAVTHSRVVLYPDRIWPSSLFEGLDKPSLRTDSMLFIDAKDFNSSKLHPDYLLLSTDLVQQVVSNSSFHAKVPNQKTRKALDHIILSKKLKTVGLPKRMRNNLYENVTTNFSLRESFAVVDESMNTEVSFLLQWDCYKDRWHVKYQDPIEATNILTNSRVKHTVGTCRHGPRVLVGIFTIQNHETERKRRKAIRETYLTFFSQQHALGNDRNRICSLLEFLSTSSQGNQSLMEDCQLAYVFVAGGNRTGPTERLVPDISNPMTLPLTSTNETDLLLLNIKENMNQGKSQSFFKFATTIVDEYLYFDYIAKVDSDTLVFPDKLLNNVFNALPRFPNNVRVYGGTPRIKRKYNELNGPAYQQGAFYWMSVDLARFITSVNCDREKYYTPAEDKAIGNFIHAHPLPIHRYQLSSFSSQHLDHPIKKVKDFRNRWAKYIHGRSLVPGNVPNL